MREKYNYADEIIKDRDNLKLHKIDEQDILQNILNENTGNNIDAEDKIKGFMEGLKSDNNSSNL